MRADPKWPAINFYIGDWKKEAGLQVLSLEHKGAWWEMLQLMHDSDERGKLLLNGKPMPIIALAKLLGTTAENMAALVADLLANGVAEMEQETGIVYCRRMVRESKLHASKVYAGSKGGKQKASNVASKHLATSPTYSSSSSIAVAIASSEPPSTPPTEPTTAEKKLQKQFDAFWAAYPLKIDEDAARAEWLRIQPAPALVKTIMASLEAHKQSRQWTKDNGDFIPHPKNWLFNRRWEAAVVAEVANGNQRLSEKGRRTAAAILEYELSKSVK